MKRTSYTSTFPAMTTTVTVMSVGINGSQHHRAMEQIALEVDGWERRFSRFRPESLLSRVNANAGRWTTADATFLDLLETARNAVFATNGRFNPAILPALEAHGYDQTFDKVRQAHRPVTTLRDRAIPSETWTEVDINRPGMRVRLPPGLRIDLGGIAKGALADLLANRYERWSGGAISIGGDMRVWGLPPDGDAWRVGIEHPANAERDITSVEVLDGSCGAIATSSRTKRAWHTGNGPAHHLIDPTMGTPVTSSLLAVSVCAPTATSAEIVTKNIMVASAHGPLTADLLLDAHWALTVSNTLDLARIMKEAA